MRKNFGAKAMRYPMSVYLIGTYGVDDTPNAMNAAWGSICKVVSEHRHGLIFYR